MPEHQDGERLIHIPKEPKDRRARVEYILQQAQLGHHTLFDASTLHAALQLGQLSDEDAYAVEPFVERLMLLPSLQEMRAYVRELDPPTRARVVLTYLTIVENGMIEALEVRH